MTLAAVFDEVVGGPIPQYTLAARYHIAGLVGFALLALVAGTYAVRVAVRDRVRYPIFVVLGAGLGVFLEPIVDVMGHCIFPNEPTWIAVLGRNIPPYAGLAYFSYFSLPVLVLVRHIATGVTPRQWWRWYGCTVAGLYLFEVVPVHHKLWYYYGDNQPFDLFGSGLPVWWCFLNTHCLFMVATAVHLLKTHVLPDRLTFVLVPLYPALMVASYGAAFPVFTAINSSESRAVTNVGGVLAIALALIDIWIASLVVTRSRPAASVTAGAAARRLTPAGRR